MTVSLNADEIKAIIAEYFSISEDDIRVGTIETKNGMKIEHLPTVAIRNCDMCEFTIVKK